MRFLKPLLAGAALLALAVPTLASAHPYYGDYGQQYHHDGGYDRHQGDGAYGWRDHGRRDHADRRYGYRDNGYRDNGYRAWHRHNWRARWERHNNW